MRNTSTQRSGTAGFTLIELLVVVGITGVLAAIAIPQFALYRARGFNARLEVDARNVATAQEGFFLDNNTYASDCNLPGFALSADDACTMAPGGTGSIGTSFKATVTNTNGAATFANGCSWDSAPAQGTPNLSCS